MPVMNDATINLKLRAATALTERARNFAGSNFMSRKSCKEMHYERVAVNGPCVRSSEDDCEHLQGQFPAGVGAKSPDISSHELLRP